MNHLEKILQSLIRKSSVMKVKKATSPLPLLASKFGGVPYLEMGEEWPICPACKIPLSFICQLDLRQTNYARRNDVPFFTFYYCNGCYPTGYHDEPQGAWLMKVYRNPTEQNAADFPVPKDVTHASECSVDFSEKSSLPDWEGTALHCPEASDISCEFNSESPWEAYQEAVEQLVGVQEIQSVVGGYPKWVQGESTPEGTSLLAQIDTESEANIMWGDVGCVYLFLANEGEPRVSMELQCC